MRILKHLSETIGCRVAGTQGEYAAAQFIGHEFQALGLEKRIQKFTFLNWFLRENPRLQILEPIKEDIAVAPMTYTLSTPQKGINGRVRKIGRMYIVPGHIEWPKYSIEDETGNELGFFVANPNGAAVPLPNSKSMLPAAGTIIGKEDAQQIDAWLEERKTVRALLFNAGEFGPACSQNVIGILGKDSPRIVVSAHYDSVLYSPGAVDNASGVQVIYDVARMLQDGQAGMKTIAFVATGCEEPGFWGSRHFVRSLKERGLLETIEFCINFDMVGRGDAFVLRAAPKTGELLMQTLEQARLEGKYVVNLDNLKASSDNWSFEEEQIPNAQVLSLPFPLYHHANDVLDEVDREVVKGATEIGFNLVRGLAQ